MIIRPEEGKTEYGPGIRINLTGSEVALAIYDWIESKNIIIKGPRTVTVNGQRCKFGSVYVDPSGSVEAH